MRKLPMLLLLLTYSICLTAQEVTSDQLKKELDAHPQEDTFRVNRLIALSFSSNFSFVQRGEFAKEALIISRKIGYTHGEGVAFLNDEFLSARKMKSEILISVKDNGNGIPLKIVDKIFQPFFTTKPAGQGTGLGLSLSYDIVKAHGGEIQLHTEENRGTKFTITLPA
jgi:signal transduction histidine kinase